MNKSNERVAVGLSGGVDSAVAAHLLKQQGYTVTGIFMKNWDEDDGTEYCTAMQDLEDAERIAEHLKIDLKQVNFAAEYWDLVFVDFLHEYERARTPNPDVLCNRHIKFSLFTEYAKTLGIEMVATGHYARRCSLNNRFQLYRAKDKHKDQTYFLQAVPKHKLENVLFPLSGMTKSEVRATAYDLGLHVFDKRDSTGICFIGERRFDDFLARYVPKNPGEIQTDDGRVLGSHMGLAYYTLGQRKGIGVGGIQNAPEAPWYVVHKRAEDNVLIVSQDEGDLLSHSLTAQSLNWLVEDPFEYTNLSAMTRYRQRPESCRLKGDGSSISVVFDQPQRAVTPGQYIAIYQDDLCLGGGKIEATQGGKFDS